MAVNPFVYDRPLPPGELVDRARELELLLELAAGGHAARLTAPRRYGKTTLLGALADAAWHVHEMVPAVVDLSQVTSLEDMAVRIVRAYERGLDRGPVRGALRALRRRGTLTAQVGLPGGRLTGGLAAAPEHVVAQLHDALDLPRRVHERTGRRCLVVLDEFQDVLVVDDRLDGLVRSHVQHHVEAASYVFAGSQPSLMRTLFADRGRPLYEQARPVELGPLAAADLADWIEDRLERAGRADLADLVDGLVALSEGHPQRAMLLANALFEQAEDDPDALAHAVADAVRRSADSLEAAWRGLTVLQRKVLGAVAAGHDRLLSADALAYTGAGKSTQRGARDQLIAMCHLRREGDRVVFVDPLMRLWLRRTADLA